MPSLKPMRRMKGLNRLHHLKDVRALKGGSDFEEGSDGLPELGDVRPLDVFADEEEDQVGYVLRRLGNNAADGALAQRIVGWMQTEIPNATIPEAIVYDYLKISGRPFVYQAYIDGGRASKGGVVPDFLVDGGGEWLMWNVQGDYWHSEGINKGKDEALRYRMVGRIVLGMAIRALVEMWESDLYDRMKRQLLFELAYIGKGLRG